MEDEKINVGNKDFKNIRKILYKLESSRLKVLQNNRLIMQIPAKK